MKLTGLRKIIIGLIFLLNANILYITSAAINKLDLMIQFMIFLAGIMIGGNVGEHFANRPFRKKNDRRESDKKEFLDKLKTLNNEEEENEK
jgi:hypothetical protein